MDHSKYSLSLIGLLKNKHNEKLINFLLIKINKEFIFSPHVAFFLDDCKSSQSKQHEKMSVIGKAKLLHFQHPHTCKGLYSSPLTFVTRRTVHTHTLCKHKHSMLNVLWDFAQVSVNYCLLNCSQAFYIVTMELKNSLQIKYTVHNKWYA